jgi:hypothetical protein
MDIENIVAVLRSEFDRIGQAIGLLENNTPTKARIGRPPGSGAKNSGPKRGGGLTSAGRRKLSESMKRRWAQRRGGKVAPKATPPAISAGPKKRGGITAAGRKKLSEAMKARWAAKKRKGA